MGRKLIYLVLPLFLACNKSYEYVEVVNERSVFGDTELVEKDPIAISADNDSIAYFKAFKKFCIAEKVNEDMVETYGSTYSTPITFKLLDDEGKDITYKFSYVDQNINEANIREEITGLPNSLKNIKEKVEEERVGARSVDSTRYNELVKKFNIRQDEFDPNGLVFYKPKAAPKYVNRNGIYCYLITNSKGVPLNLRLRIQHHDDDWLFFERVQFSIDGEAFEYIPSSTETDNGNGGRIWEWSDDAVGESEMEILKAIGQSKDAKIKLIGSQYHKIKEITYQQKLDISRVLDLYETLEGSSSISSL